MDVLKNIRTWSEEIFIPSSAFKYIYQTSPEKKNVFILFFPTAGVMLLASASNFLPLFYSWLYLPREYCINILVPVIIGAVYIAFYVLNYRQMRKFLVTKWYKRAVVILAITNLFVIALGFLWLSSWADH